MLPKIDVPIHTLKLVTDGKLIRFRPFTVKEEKILLIAMESSDEKIILDSVKQIINNCCLDDIDVEDMPIVDLEFLFLNLRARSVGEIVNLQYRCNNIIKKESGEEVKCNNLVKFDLNILEVQPEFNEKHTNKIEIDNNLGIVMKYPNFKNIESLSDESEVEKVIKTISSCIDFIYDKDTIYYSKDVSPKELQEFIESFSREQFLKIQEFFNTIPKIKKEVDFKCSKCGYEEKIVLEGIQSFFV